MKIFNWLWKITPIYAIYNFIVCTITYLRARHYVADTFYSDAFKNVINRYLNIDLKEDWIGRLYGVGNPNIRNGKYDVTSMVIEIDGDNTNNNEQVKNWAYKQLQLIAQLFKIEKLYDYISLEFRHVGPEEFDNYLLVFDITSRKTWSKSFRYLFINLSVCTIIFILFFEFLV